MESFNKYDKIVLREAPKNRSLRGGFLSDLNKILKRIVDKKKDYEQYGFSQVENNALMTFFDLAQEFGTIAEFYKLCVAIPKGFFDMEARLYLIDPRTDELVLSAKTSRIKAGLGSPPPKDVRPEDYIYRTARKSLVLTIRGKQYLVEQLPFHTKNGVLGILEVEPADRISAHGELFFSKFANRIGYRMHNKFLAEKNAEHLRFIRSLVADIEHNIIVPNMVYKLFLRRLRAKIIKNTEIEARCAEAVSAGVHDLDMTKELLDELSDVNMGMRTELENLEKHYKNMSLFIETLFRKSHFDQGHLTLRTKQCNMKNDVVIPQLDRYLEQFKDANISIDDRLSGIPDEEVVNVVDVGLIAQVYANLFSNAVKYTQPVEIFGEIKKYIAYGHEIMTNYFGPGKDGAKFNVFSTGPHIPVEERKNLFKEDYRGINSSGIPGTGHGLAFIKNAIQIHGGVVGYEATDYGNNFYFILPL